MALVFREIPMDNSDINKKESTSKFYIDDNRIELSVSPKLVDFGGLVSIKINGEKVVTNKSIILNEGVIKYVPLFHDLKGMFFFLDEDDNIDSFNITRFGYKTFLFYIYDDEVDNNET